MVNIEPEKLSLYLNMIGGHSFFVVYEEKYLIKNVGTKELKFYEFIKKNKILSQHIPNFYGIIEKNTKQYEYIIEYKKKCDLFFKNMVKFFNIKLEDIDIEKEIIFKQKFEDFINDKNYSNNNLILDESFDILKEQLISLKNTCQKKLFWLFYWYIKWQKEFTSDKYIIIENLEYGIKKPCVIDIKLGSEKKISKETGKVKIWKGACESLGCRIMGISSNNIYFKSRYETKELNEDEFNSELIKFFSEKKNILVSIINELKEIVNFIENNFCFKIYFCSLLIFFDNSENDNRAIVKLIDFNLTNNSQIFRDINKEKCDNEKCQINNDLIKCINNLINTLINIYK